VVAIIGPSGSGKTTFLRCLNFLEEPTSGTIVVGDIKIDGSKPLSQQQGLIRQLRQHVGFVFQNFNLFPHRTALENVIEGPTVVKKMPREQAVELGRNLLARSALLARKTPTPVVCPVGSSSAWRLPERWRWSLR
jgi:cystine transport system ATP-binding protein